MVEAQLNIYHHFCSQTVAWGPTSWRCVCCCQIWCLQGGQLWNPHPPPGLCPLGGSPHCPRGREECWEGQAQRGKERTAGGRLGPGPTSTTLFLSVPFSPSFLSLFPPPSLPRSIPSFLSSFLYFSFFFFWWGLIRGWAQRQGRVEGWGRALDCLFYLLILTRLAVSTCR